MAVAHKGSISMGLEGQPLAGKGNAGRQPAWNGAPGKCTRFRNRIPFQYGPVKTLYHPVNSIKWIK